MLNNYLNYTDSIKRFELEDIQAQIKDSQNPEEKLILEKRKISKMNKYSSRIKDIFNTSPISKPNEFYAQKYFIILLNISMIRNIQLRPSMLRLVYVVQY